MKKLIVLKFLLLCSTFMVHAQINLDTTSFYPAIKDQNFENKNIVAIGEAHTIRNTYSTEFFIFKALFKKGYKTIYIEFGEAEATILNTYMATGDSILINHTMAKWWNAAFYKEFLQPAYQLNKTSGYEIKFKGFDFERPASVGYLFSSWFSDITIGSIDFKKLSTDLLAMNEFEVNKNITRLAKAMTSIKTSFTQNEAQYKEILKDNFSAFKKIVFNPITNYNTRDANFVKTILEAENDGQLNKAIIITGNHHLLATHAFMPMLVDKLPVQYTVTLFPFIYSKCLNKNGNKLYSSHKKNLKYVSLKNEQAPLIKFRKTDQSIISSKKIMISTILVELYNQ